MADEQIKELERQLDLLVSLYRQKVGALAVAETLLATANGIVALEQNTEPRWFSQQRAVDVPYQDIDSLTSSIDDIFTRRALCVSVDGVPMYEDVTLRIVAGDKHVELDARCVQEIASGFVFKIGELDAEQRSALEQLTGALRTAEPATEIDRHSVRVPTVVSEEVAREALAEILAPPPPVREPEDSFAVLAGGPAPPEDSFAELGAEPTTGVHEAYETHPIDELEPVNQKAVLTERVPERVPEAGRKPAPTPRTARRATAERTGLRKSTIDAAELRLRSKNFFEVLGIHFSANGKDVIDARDELLELLKPHDDDDAELLERLKRIRSRIREAADVLSDQKTRRRHRTKVVDKFQMRSALEMFDRRGETAKIRHDASAAIEAYQHVLELKPNDEYALEQIANIKRGEFDDDWY